MSYSELIEGYNPAFYMEGFEVPQPGQTIPGSLGLKVDSVTGSVSQVEDGLHFYDGLVNFRTATLPRHTWSFWLRLDTGETRSYGVFHGERGSYDYRFGAWMAGGSHLWYQNVTESDFFTTYFTRGQWTNVVLVAEGSDYSRIYVNGVQRKYQRDGPSHRFGNTVTNTALTIGTGSNPSAGDGFMLRGTLSGFAMLPVSLTASQVSELYAAGPPVPPAPTEPWSILENGLEVPLELEGEKMQTHVPEPTFAADSTVHIPLEQSSYAPVTMSMWAKKPTGTLNTFHGLFGHQAGTTLATGHYVLINFIESSHLHTAGAYRAGFDRSIFDDGEFHHFAYTAEDGTFRLYVDGNPIISGPSGASTSLTDMRVASVSSGSNDYQWNGEVSNFAYWPEVMDASRVMDLYKAGPQVDYTLPFNTVRPLSASFYEAPQRRQYDIGPYLASTDAASDVVEMVTATDPFEDAYGLKLSASISAATRSNYTRQAVDIDDPLTKQGFKVFIDELAKYPAEFVAAANVGELVLVKDLQGPSGAYIRGVAFLSDMYGSWMNVDTNQGHVRHRGTWISSLRFTFHHELMHLLSKRYENDWNAMEAEWVSHNSTAYIGSAWETQETVIHPAGGFFRDYSMHSYREDMADVLAAVMVSHIQPEVEALIATDPAIAAKVAMMKNWLASKNTMFADENYYITIHSD